jgi:heptosyltransferase-2
MKILCICPIGIGNYLLVYPACALLRKAFPDARLHLLALRRPISEIAQRDPLWERVHSIDPTRERSLARQWDFVNLLAKENYDASLSFFPSNNWQYNLLPFFWGIKKRYAFDYPLKKGASLSFLNNHSLPIDPLLHDVHQNLKLAALFTGKDGADAPPVFPQLFGSEEKTEARNIIGETPGPGTVIGIHAGSSGEHGMAAKRWDPMRFGELANRVAGEFEAQVLIFGGPDEEKLKHVVASVVSVPHRIIGSRGLPLTAALISECAVFLCNDSGLMHIAACMKVPVAAVFGPTDDRRNGPVGGETIVIRKEMEGFPLWTAATVGVRGVKTGGVDPQASLRALTVDDAWEKILPWLRRVKTARAGRG